MFAFVVSPTIGRAVSKGALATKEPVGPNGAGFVCARKGTSPVAVGPGGRFSIYQLNRGLFIEYLHRSREWSESTEALCWCCWLQSQLLVSCPSRLQHSSRPRPGLG